MGNRRPPEKEKPRRSGGTRGFCDSIKGTGTSEGGEARHGDLSAPVFKLARWRMETLSLI